MNSVANTDTSCDSKVGQELRDKGLIFWGVMASPYQLKMQALYDGTLLGRPFRAVVKTFQVAVWRELCVQWDALAETDREYVSHLLPAIAQISDRVASE